MLLSEIIASSNLPDTPSLWRRRFPFNDLGNRRFMYNPDRDSAIIGWRDYRRNGTIGSHAEEFHTATGSNRGYDDFYIRGWVGKGNNFPHGIIHFAPPLPTRWLADPERFDDVHKCIDYFLRSGATPATTVRGYGDTLEQPISALQA